MSIPNGGLINETNAQYYAGAQQFLTSSIGGTGQTFTATFDTALVFSDSDPGTNGYNLNNFKVFTSPNANVWTELSPTGSQTTGVVENATGGASILVDLVAFNSSVQVGMVVSGEGVDAGTTVIGTDNPAAAITGNAFTIITANVGAKLSNSSFNLTTVVAGIQTGDAIDYVGAGTPGWINYTPPSSVTLVQVTGVAPNQVTNFSLSPFQPNFSVATTPLIRFQPALAGSTILTLTAYNAAFIAGMKVTGDYIANGTIVVSNTSTLVAGAQRSVIVLNKSMTRRPDSLGVYSFNTQEITLNQNATVVNGTTLAFKNVAPFSEANNVVTVNTVLPSSVYIKIELNENALQNSHGSYEYTRLNDVIDNFLVAYVGAGKLITSIKRTDVIFHARRGLQEFSYDTLKSVKSQELTVPSSLSLIIPQDYVNYTNIGWYDALGVLHPIYPTNNLNQSPYYTPIQDDLGVPVQDSNASNTEGNSLSNAAWNATDPRRISGGYINNIDNSNAVFDRSVYEGALGQRYGLEPQTSQKNGWFKIDERKGTFNFTSNLSNQLILLEYISDGNAYDLDARIPKLAEEALYSYIIYNILSTSSGIQEYVVRRFQKEKSSKLRNAKIRLSNLKIDQIAQVMRGKSKWLKF